SHAGQSGLGRVTGVVVVDLHDQTRPRRNSPRHARRDLERLKSRRPAAQATLGLEARSSEARVAVAAIELDRAPGDVEKGLDVMNHFPIAWEHFEAANEPPLAGNRDRYGAAAVDVARSPRNGARPRHCQHGPAPAERP